MGSWVVEGMVPKGHTVLLLGQPGSLKSWFAQQMAICVSSSKDFINYPTYALPTIIIDQDTPSDLLYERLDRIAAGKAVSLKALTETKMLDVRSMTDFQFSDQKSIKELREQIKQSSTEVMVIFDSLSSLMKGLNENSTKDALKVAEAWNELKNAGATLIVIHHLSSKKVSNSPDEFLGTAMGNTHLISKSDTILSMVAVPGSSTRAILNTKARRVHLPVVGPLGLELVENNIKSWASLIQLEGVPNFPSDHAVRIFPLFYIDHQELTVIGVLKQVKGDLSDIEARAALHELEKEGCVLRMVEKGTAHRFNYRLSNTMAEKIPVTIYQQELIKMMP